MSRAVISTFLLMILSNGAISSDLTRQRMPCLEKLCVGDDILRIENVEWQTAVNPANGLPLSKNRTSDKYAHGLKAILRGAGAAIVAVAPYWYLRRFDADGLRVLRDIHAVCDPLGVSQRLRAEYRDRQGNRVVVHFAPTATDDGRAQRFLVTMIRRHFSEITQPWQLKAMGDQLGARYEGFGAYASETKPGVVWNPHAKQGPNITLLAPFGDSSEQAEKLRMHPACATSVGAEVRGLPVPESHAPLAISWDACHGSFAEARAEAGVTQALTVAAGQRSAAHVSNGHAPNDRAAATGRHEPVAARGRQGPAPSPEGQPFRLSPTLGPAQAAHRNVGLTE
ncbi:MAG: hypothetical protein IV092_14645 [Burkholderiaceae bacterium]|nr:hypothetical protein [Burkholderiaceae bacterium]